MPLHDHKNGNDEEDSTGQQSLILHGSTPPQARTLLPAPLATAISLVTRSSSLYVQLGSFLGGLAIDGARVTTLTGLEFSRSVIETILHQAGGDVAARSTGELGRAEAEGILERSVATLHRTVTAVSFAASAGFHISATVLGGATDLSQQLLASLDSILGSTDSSRAISSIVTLIRREFQNPATGREGEKVGVLDLLVGLCGLALLQRWCEKIALVKEVENAWQEVIWDVVTLSDGASVDVLGEADLATAAGNTSLPVERGSDNGHGPLLEEHTEDDASRLATAKMVALRNNIMSSLPHDTSISIKTETSFSKVMSVKIVGACPTSFILPEDVQIMEESTTLAPSSSSAQNVPVYHAVYSLGSTSCTESTMSPMQHEALYDNEDTLEETLINVISKGESATTGSRSNVSTPRTGDINTVGGVIRANDNLSQEIGANMKRLRQSVSTPSSPTSTSLWSKLRSNARSSTTLSTDRNGDADKQHMPPTVVTRVKTVSSSPAASRPSSPTNYRHHSRSHSQMLHQQADRTASISSTSSNPLRARVYASSIHTIKTSASSISLTLLNDARATDLEPKALMSSLRTTGQMTATFPSYHLIRNMARFVRFSSASYGSSFLRVMGIATISTSPVQEFDLKHHHEHHSFSNHTQLPPDTILLSSFVDPAGGTDSTGHTGTGVPMVHFVSLDHDSKAVVLTCRGTLGFEDILTDMACDYDTLTYQGKEYSVHRGIHASARRLLNGEGSKVIATITAALEEFPEYGVVMCGHSLGGAVVALLAIMVSQPSSTSDGGFVTSSCSPLLSRSHSSTTSSKTAHDTAMMPQGRPIHVYAYGPPAALSPALRRATRGLITCVVNGQDVVPYLSLGVLHDLQGVALAFKNDNTGAKGELRARIWEGLKGNFTDGWYSQPPSSIVGTGDDDMWAYSALKVLRASMLSHKLVPPGEVFQVQSSPVFRRDAFVSGGETSGLGKPATRSVLKYVSNVEKKFGEIRFASSILGDHSPGRYEASLSTLAKGILG